MLSLAIEHSASASSIHAQVSEQIQAQIESGALKSGYRLPPTRDLARQLSISRGTVVKAYQDLSDKGYLESNKGGGTTVRQQYKRGANKHPTQHAKEGQAYRDQSSLLATGDRIKNTVSTFLPGITAVEHLPLIEFRKAFSNALRYPDYLRDSGSILGDLQLRKQICKHILPTRGILADPEQLVIGPDIRQITLLAGIVLNGSLKSVHYGSPGRTELVKLFETLRIPTIAHPVDSEGVNIDFYALTAGDLLIACPEHHFPTGAPLSLARRQKIVEYHLKSGFNILEDDSESEYYFDHLPNSALFSKTNGKKHLYVNSLSTLYFNGLQVAYGVSSPEFVNEIAKAQKMISNGVSVLIQRWTAEMISSGAVNTHVSRMRNVYRRKRDALELALSEVFPDWRVIVPKGGLQICVELPLSLPSVDFFRATKLANIEMMDQTEYLAENSKPSQLITFSFSGDDPKKMKESLLRLRQEIEILKTTST